ncbi:hypothetical protein AB0K80_33530 [Streptomyces sp. NPDC052682]|uniref:DUF4388 domain-containing protein n=1 Tax=Streptomyces sp. NPDC052682 TaxID=3154954 RepID=UPI00343FB0F3
MTAASRTDQPASALLQGLAAERATGALSTGSGIVYLSDGHVVHAESACTPDLGTLLIRGGALAPDGWREAVDRAGARHRVGRHLVDSGRIGAGALELCHLGALFDAAYFALAHDRPAVRFRRGAVHWLGTLRPVPVEAVLRESRRRRDLLQRIWPEPAVDTAPLARVPGTGPAELPARRRRTLAQVDGVRTAAQIAAHLACRTFHTLVELRRLAAAGLVTPGPPPQARPGPATPDEPDTALLRRLLHALEAL